MEACGSAHHFGRWLQSLGHRVALLPPQYVRPYLRAATKPMPPTARPCSNTPIMQWLH